MNKYIPACLALTMIAMILSFSSKNKMALDGAWAIVEVQTVKANGTVTSVFPIESEAVFAHNYYSFCWTSHHSTTRSWQMTDSVKLDRINQSIVNSGTYEVKDSLLTTKAIFAMNPVFVNGLSKFKCSFNGDTLILTGLNVSSSDNIPNPLYASGSHIVNKLVRLSKR